MRFGLLGRCMYTAACKPSEPHTGEAAIIMVTATLRGFLFFLFFLRSLFNVRWGAEWYEPTAL